MFTSADPEVSPIPRSLTRGLLDADDSTDTDDTGNAEDPPPPPPITPITRSPKLRPRARSRD